MAYVTYPDCTNQMLTRYCLSAQEDMKIIQNMFLPCFSIISFTSICFLSLRKLPSELLYRTCLYVPIMPSPANMKAISISSWTRETWYRKKTHKIFYEDGFKGPHVHFEMFERAYKQMRNFVTEMLWFGVPLTSNFYTLFRWIVFLVATLC